jgi:hypothetical protein
MPTSDQRFRSYDHSKLEVLLEIILDRSNRLERFGL